MLTESHFFITFLIHILLFDFQTKGDGRMPVITISRQFGAGGLTLGKQIADKIGYAFVSDEIIRLIAKKARVSQSWVHSIEKEAGGKLQRFISSVVPRGLVDRIIDDQRGYIDEDIYLDLLDQIITQIASEDNCVILGRGGQYILKDHKNVSHVLLIADKEDRIRFMQTHYNLARTQAVQVVAAEDKRRTALYRKLHKSDYDHPEHYHITLNMSKLSLELAQEMICQLVGAS